MGFDYIHSAIDDHTRLAYSEIHPDDRVATCAGLLTSAAAFFRAHGITRIQRVLTDNVRLPFTTEDGKTVVAPLRGGCQRRAVRARADRAGAVLPGPAG